jgi:hypothetical protein
MSINSELGFMNESQLEDAALLVTHEGAFF